MSNPENHPYQEYTEEEFEQLRKQELRHSARPRMYTLVDSDGNPIEPGLTSGLPPNIYKQMFAINELEAKLYDAKMAVKIDMASWLTANHLEAYYDKDEPSGKILIRNPGNKAVAIYTRSERDIDTFVRKEIARRDAEDPNGNTTNKQRKRLSVEEAYALHNPQPKKPKQIRIAKGYDKRPKRQLGKAYDPNDPEGPNPYGI